VFGFALALLCGSEAQAHCLDLRNPSQFDVQGVLSHHVFPGPPNFESVTSGDAPEPTYILELQEPLCVSGDDFIGDLDGITTIHLVPSENTSSFLRRLQDRRVRAVLYDAFGAHTGHHHAPLVARVASVAALGDVVDEYGTAATVVRGFYYALAAGDGRAAARFVIPEKRASGPLSAAALTGFYRNLTVPLSLRSVEPLRRDTYLARYTFTNGSKRCNGRAEVTTVRRRGENLIQRIKALDGC
jgi:hypothetical protein